jgi:hypothetical protein
MMRWSSKLHATRGRRNSPEFTAFALRGVAQAGALQLN